MSLYFNYTLACYLLLYIDVAVDRWLFLATPF